MLDAISKGSEANWDSEQQTLFDRWKYLGITNNCEIPISIQSQGGKDKGNNEKLPRRTTGKLMAARMTSKIQVIEQWQRRTHKGTRIGHNGPFIEQRSHPHKGL